MRCKSQISTTDANAVPELPPGCQWITPIMAVAHGLEGIWTIGDRIGAQVGQKVVVCYKMPLQFDSIEDFRESPPAVNMKRHKAEV